MPWLDADVALLGEVYDLECISRMNVIYYESRLGRIQNYSFWMEVVTAATASGSGLAAVSFLQAGPGKWVWQVLALTAALVAVIRPIYAPGKKIEAFTRQHQGYHANYFALKKLASSIRHEASVTTEHRRRYDTIFDRHVQLSTEDETPPAGRIVEEARKRTEEELPPARFWWPSEEAEVTKQDIHTPSRPASSDNEEHVPEAALPPHDTGSAAACLEVASLQTPQSMQKS